MITADLFKRQPSVANKHFCGGHAHRNADSVLAGEMSMVGPVIAVLRPVWKCQQEEVLAEQIRAKVIKTFGSGCAALVGHFMGTLFVTETLVLNPDPDVDTLVTLGSPLSMQTANGLRGKPPSDGQPTPRVRRWVSIYDPRDPVDEAAPVDRPWPTAEDYGVGDGHLPHAIGRHLSRKITGQVTTATVAATRQ